MKHRQTETRHLFGPNPPKERGNLAANAKLESGFLFWLDAHADEEELQKLMQNCLPDWTRNFVHVFVGNTSNGNVRYIAVSWQEDADRNAIYWGEKRPDHIEKYTVQGPPSYMLNAETIAAIVTMLPPERK